MSMQKQIDIMEEFKEYYDDGRTSYNQLVDFILEKYNEGLAQSLTTYAAAIRADTIDAALLAVPDEVAHDELGHLDMESFDTGWFAHQSATIEAIEKLRV